MGRLAWPLVAVLVAGPSVAAGHDIMSLANDFYELSVGSDPDTGVLSVTSLKLRATKKDWTRELLVNNKSDPGIPLAESERASVPAVLLTDGTIAYSTAVAQTTWSMRKESPARSVATFSRVAVVAAANQTVAWDDWQLSIDGPSLEWKLERRWAAAVQVAADRLALSFHTVSAAAAPYGAQVPSVVAVDILVNETTAAGFPFGKLNEFVTGRGQARHVIHLAPSNIRLCSRVSGGALALGKTPTDGTATEYTVGVEGIAREAGKGEPRERGDVDARGWALRVALDEVGSTCAPPGEEGEWPREFAGVLDVAFPNAPAAAAASVRNFQRAQNLFNGFLFGNNPASVPCLQEMGWFGWIGGLYSTQDPRNQAALARQVELFAKTAVFQNGYVMPRLYSAGYYYVPWGAPTNQASDLVIFAHAQAVATGDRAWAAAVWPAVTRTVEFILRNSPADTGVYHSAPSYFANGTVYQNASSGIADGGRHSDSWYDITEFGGYDAINALDALIALEAAADMAAWQGDAAAAARYAAAFEKGKEGYNRLFWSETHGYYADWVDVNGEARYYFHVDHNFLAVHFGVADTARARRILAEADAYQNAFARRQNMTREALWAIPSNLVPIRNPLEYVNGTSAGYPGYQNGQAFYHSTGFEILGRAAGGDRAGGWAAFERFFAAEGVAVRRGWAQTVAYTTNGTNVYGGLDPLNNAQLVLWGACRGLFGVWPTLTRGLIITQPRAGERPVPQMEGAKHTFTYLGADVSVCVAGGKTRLC